MAARFTQGTNLKSTRTLPPESRSSEPPKMSKGRQGMPGYIKTRQDASSSGLKGRGARGGSIPAVNGPRSIPSRKGESRKNWQSATSTGGSQDKSYFNTSTDKAGTIRRGGEPKAPASRSKSEMETKQPARNMGSRTAVSNGGIKGMRHLPQGGAQPGSGGAHTPGAGHRGLGSGNPSGMGKAAPMRARSTGGRAGTMESLAGKTRTGNITSRRKSMMY